MTELEAILAEIDPARLPRHVAIIMDGNGRWARSKGLPRSDGHTTKIRWHNLYISGDYAGTQNGVAL